ncbi:Slp family lipoprotein [Permianibacter sp. IMCC34836]|uniref:Slp family lipoprotein n=1 Tax=Permianibacter fluminis TaxID=2738515 RepID=UPI001555B937|nr:Slp family lipoprotein [Permianibacter fluminis]NQD37710.1 Slp family lipoprotein [Permianibacter fluminis]
MTKHLWTAAVISVLLAACANVPESVQGPADPNITLATVRGNDAAVNGQLVRWGGLVARVQNKDNQSWIEIVEQPLGSSGRPVGGNVTGGRFIAIFGGFLDPLIFKTGSEITVVGSLQPGVEGKIDDQPYKFPVLSGSGYHLWEPRADRHYDDVLLLRGSYWDPFWYRPYYPVIIHHYHPAPTPRGAGTGSSTSTGHGGAGPGAGNTSTTQSTTPSVTQPTTQVATSSVTEPRRPPVVRAEPRKPLAEREAKPKRRDDKER